MATEDEALSGELVDETARLDLDELCALCGVQADHLVEMVEAGVIRPEGDRQTVWRFSAVAVMRSRKALRLRRDLDINLPGLAVTLDLLDEVDRLQNELKSLRRRLGQLQD
ncbi:MAG: chaperone modulator CbpM [Geminicoccaceae bacterium]|jgi:chaperone modulatory protein CbpM|nr:chaperone modulator CbpM [Geminicoccaceae bacterium]MCB9966792.1 chaperone modulator CbpM [Geminicoccaceae bacterium]HRY23874.1 chaperone modulator CbpM [Geminicoccaceae bacterium]